MRLIKVGICDGDNSGFSKKIDTADPVWPNGAFESGVITFLITSYVNEMFFRDCNNDLYLMTK